MSDIDLARVLSPVFGGEPAAGRVIETVVAVVEAEVARGGSVALKGFGVFDSVDRDGTRLPRFRPGTTFRQVVAESPVSDDASASPPVRFSRFTLEPGLSLSAVLQDGLSRCGVYVLHFTDGSSYVGQSVDVLSRFATHVRRWGESMLEIDFAPIERDRLDQTEIGTIQWFERQDRALRNSALVGMPMGDSPLDLVVDRVEQERWLTETAGEPDLRDRVDEARSRPRSGQKFLELSAREDYEGIRLALAFYVLQVLPWPQDTEGRFWSISAMPSTNRSRMERRLAVVSVNNVESVVLADLRKPDGEWVVAGFVNTAPRTLSGEQHEIRRSRYRTVGEVDQVVFIGWEGLIELLQDPDVVAGSRRLAMGLMRKGRGMLSRFHDTSLADDLFAVLDR